ncbi:MAG: hypothetical protein H7A51_07555 [Akkermansiaceae bacterium]|nr:hypothetical protein [Akkermansiaceae bacterium]
MKTLILITAFACLSSMTPAFADTLRETYIAKLSTRDHFNSKGQRLTNAAAIIRQDRANFHKYGKRDAGDQSDKFFASANNRALLEKFINRGRSTKSALQKIVNGTPSIVVKIYRNDSGDDYINVTVID